MHVVRLHFPWPNWWHTRNVAPGEVDVVCAWGSTRSTRRPVVRTKNTKQERECGDRSEGTFGSRRVGARCVKPNTTFTRDIWFAHREDVLGRSKYRPTPLRESEASIPIKEMFLVQYIHISKYTVCIVFQAAARCDGQNKGGRA